MHFAGLAWTGDGFELAVVDDAGTPTASPAHFPAGSVASLIDAPAAAGQPGTPTRVRRGEHQRHGGRRPEGGRPACAPRRSLAPAGAAGRSPAHGPRDTAEKLIALTFDDGPDPAYPGRVLDVLDRYGAPATFLCVGLHTSAHAEEPAPMAEAGPRLRQPHLVAPLLPDLSADELAAQPERTDDAITAGGGDVKRRMFRPPYGSRTPEVLEWLAGRPDGPTVVLGDVEAADWAMPGADAIARSVLPQARPGSIARLHDGGGDRSQTGEALPAIVEGLLADGYRFALVDEMLD